MSEKSDTSYEVECILDKMYKKNRVYYKIKWAGYSYSECTWEPSNHLSGNCDRLIREFEDRQKEQRKRKRKKTRTKQPKAPVPTLKSTQNTSNKLTKYFERSSQNAPAKNDQIKLENKGEPNFNYFSQGPSSDRYIDELIGIMTSSRDKKLARQHLRHRLNPARNPIMGQRKRSVKSGVVRAHGQSPGGRNVRWAGQRQRRSMGKNYPFGSERMDKRSQWKFSRKAKVIEMTDSDEEDEDEEEEEDKEDVPEEEPIVKREERFVVETGRTSQGGRKKMFNQGKRPIIKSRHHRFWSNRRRAQISDEKRPEQAQNEWTSEVAPESQNRRQKMYRKEKKTFQSMLQSKNVQMMRTPTFSRSQEVGEAGELQEKNGEADLPFEKKPFRREEFIEEGQRLTTFGQVQKKIKLGETEKETNEEARQRNIERIREAIKGTPPDEITKILMENFDYKELDEFGFENIQNLLVDAKFRNEQMRRKEKNKQRSKEAKVNAEAKEASKKREKGGTKKQRQVETSKTRANAEGEKQDKKAEMNIKKKIEGIENNIIQMLMTSAEKKIRKSFTQKEGKQSRNPMEIGNERKTSQKGNEAKETETSAQNKIRRNDSENRNKPEKAQSSDATLFTPFKMNSSMVDYQKVKRAEEDIIRHRVEQGSANQDELDYFKSVIVPKECIEQPQEPVEVVDLGSAESKLAKPEKVIMCSESGDTSNVIEIGSEVAKSQTIVNVDSPSQKQGKEGVDRKTSGSLSSQMDLIRRNLRQKKMFLVQRENGDNKTSERNKNAGKMRINGGKGEQESQNSKSNALPELSVKSTRSANLVGREVHLQKRNFSTFDLQENNSNDQLTQPEKKMKPQVSVSSANESVFPNESDPSEKSPNLEKPEDLARLRGSTKPKRPSESGDIKEKRSGRSFRSGRRRKEASTDCFDLESAVYGNFVLRHTDRIKIVSNIVVEQKLYLKVRRYRKVAQGRGLPEREEQETMFLPPEALRKVRPDLLCKFFEKHMKFI